MTITQFIEKAIEGGWAPKDAYRVGGKAQFVQLLSEGYIKYQQHKEDEPDVPIDNNYLSVEAVLLDPLAWQAVGKVEGWGTGGIAIGKSGRDLTEAEMFHTSMISALWDGKTIEQYLETL